MWKKSLPALLALILGGGALQAQAPIPSIPGCEYTRANPIPAGSTMAEQFQCYKEKGRRVSIPGTGLAHGSVNGAGCIIAIAADRVQVASCNGFTDRAITIPFASIRFVYEEERQDYVTVDLRE